MVVDWTDADTPIALDPELALDESNQPVLALQRNTTDSFVRMVASVDGPVRSAFMQARGQDCFVTLEDIAQGQWILSLFEKRGHAKGALGGSIRALHPAVVARQDQSSGEKDSYACSRWGYAKLDARFDFEARPWTATNARHVASRATDPQGLDFSQLVMHEGAIFWTTADRVRSGVNVWTPTANARPFLRDIDNSEYDAGNLGTDGENLVWTRSEGGTRSIVAASFTTDPSALDAKTLGSDPSPSVSGDAFRVACGFAAHGGKQAPVTVVRLRDGTRWSLASTFTGFEVANVIGITCDEIFLVGTFEGRVNVARVALSSLPLSTTR